MASEPQPTVTAEQLMALRSGPDALRTISEALQVKKMGPADHIRTKHEIIEFLAKGHQVDAASLIQNSLHRVTAARQRSERQRANQNYGLSP